VIGAATSPIVLDYSGIVVRVSGLAPAWTERLVREHEPYVARTIDAETMLDVRVDASARSLPDAPFAPHDLAGTFRVAGARFDLAEGSAEVDERGKVEVELVESDDPRAYFAFLNLLRASLAWSVLRNDGAMIHAAGLVVDERGFLLVGPSGTGKSTFARFGAEGGGTVVSDDIVLVRILDGAPMVLGSPFRSTWRGPMVHGRWPLAAILLAEHTRSPRLDPVSPILTRARLLANLPFTAEAGAADPEPMSAVEALVAAVPCYTLAYAPEPSFVGLLRELRAGPRDS
jgi:hypothetical protein